MERVMGIEPTSPGWEPRALPLSYTRTQAPIMRVWLSGFNLALM